MELNLPINVRRALYVLTAIGTPVVAYLADQKVIDQALVSLWYAEVTVVALLAAFNTKTPR